MEKSEIYSRIDTLVAMARSKSNIEDLENELVKLNKSIEAAKQELAEFTNTISNEKYFDASSEVVDRNIALGLTKKIKKLQETEKELKTAKDQKQTEVTSLKTDYDNMQQQIKDIDESIAAVKVRINGNSESENDKFNQKIASLQTARNDLNDSYSILGEQIAGLETELSKIEEQIKQIGHVDTLLIPVGGIATIGPEQAVDTIKRLKPSLVIPMHFHTDVLNFTLGKLEHFLEKIGGGHHLGKQEIEFDKNTLSNLPSNVMVLNYE